MLYAFAFLALLPLRENKDFLSLLIFIVAAINFH
jgi:hypothetical protein